MDYYYLNNMVIDPFTGLNDLIKNYPTIKEGYDDFIKKK